MEVNFSELLKKLESGYVRTRGDKRYNPETKNSIADWLGKTDSEIRRFFMHPKLKGLKSKGHKSDELELVDDIPEYGKRSKASMKRAEKLSENQVLDSTLGEAQVEISQPETNEVEF